MSIATMTRHLRTTLALLALMHGVALAQYDAETSVPFDDDHGEFPPAGPSSVYLAPSAAGYGYNYDSLLADIAVWSKSPRVSVDHIGRSVLDRTLWQLQITAPSNRMELREMVTIHARTHPNEPQSSHVVNAIIDHLLSDDPAMARLLDRVVFNIIPMLNPDGVELESGRVNANGVDLEREWDKEPAEIEAAELRQRYANIMSSPTPIRVALNMHSAYLCKRYFVYHVAESTSEQFARDQQRFIGAVGRYFPAGIESWHFYQSWQGGRPTHFPESWFWENFGEQVMALTYEDMHCATAGAYDTTGYAILRGIADYLGIDIATVSTERTVASRSILRSVVPNPFSSAATIRYSLPTGTHVNVRIHDALGAEVARLVDEVQSPGWHEIRWDAPHVSDGVYYVSVSAGATTNTAPILKIR
jgi:hypothetical protein